MNIVIVGHGGHSKVIEDLILSNINHRIIGYLDDRYSEVQVNHSLFFGPIHSIEKVIASFGDLKFIIGIGDNHIRKKIVEHIGLSDESYLTLIHPTAVISPSAKIGAGSVIMAKSVINADAQIGKHSIINTGAIVEHDNRIGSYVHICPSATLTGGVEVEEGAQIGAAAVIIPNIKIGRWAAVGAGAAVIRKFLIILRQPECQRGNKKQKERWCLA